MIHKTQILINAERHVSEMMRRELPKARCFHNLKHTESVVLRCHELSTFYNIPTEEKMILHLAAWFHDVGYCISSDDHESHSIQAMRNFLQHYLPEAQLNDIQNLIMATRLSVNPTCALEQMICDADLHHLGSRHYEKWSELLKREVEHYRHVTISKDDWLRENINFFNNHRFFTGFANFYWKRQKDLNLRALRQELELVC